MWAKGGWGPNYTPWVRLRQATAAPSDGEPRRSMPPKIAPKGSKTVAQKRKTDEQKGCGGVGSLAATGRPGTLLVPLGDGRARSGLACCVAQGEIKFGSLRSMTEEKLGDYVRRGTAVYEHLGPKSKPHVDFVQRLLAEMKDKKLSRYFYSSMCHCHLANVTSLLQRAEKKLSSAAPGAAQAVSAPRAEQAVTERAGGAEVAGAAKKPRIFGADPKSGNDSTPVSESKMAHPPDDVRKHDHAVDQLERDVYPQMMGLQLRRLSVAM